MGIEPLDQQASDIQIHTLLLKYYTYKLMFNY